MPGDGGGGEDSGSTNLPITEVIPPPRALLLGPAAWREALAASLTDASIESVGADDVTEGAAFLDGVDVAFFLVDDGDPLRAVSTLWWVAPNLPAILCGDDPNADLAAAARDAGIAVVMPAVPAAARLAALVDVVVGPGHSNVSDRPRAIAQAMASLCELGDEADLASSVGILAELFHADVVSILLTDAQGALRTVANVGLVDVVGVLCPAGGLGEHVLQTGTARLLIGDTRNTRGVATSTRNDVTASMLAPIRGSGGATVRGVLTIGKRRKQAMFTPKDLEVCSAVATLIGELLVRSEASREARRLQSRLSAAERLTTLGELAAGVVHDVANPLGAVRANLETLIAHLSEMRPLLEQMEASSEAVAFVLDDMPGLLCETYEGVLRATDVVRQMKQVVRLGSTGHGEAVDVAAAVESAVRMLRSRVQTPVVVVVEDRCQIEGVPVDLLQVLTNLIANGNDACSDRRRAQEQSDVAYRPEITVTLKNEGERSVIQVRDNGAGMSDDVLRRMWEQLFTTKPAGQGTGLGLPIVRRIVAEHGGTIEVSSTLGTGTEFRLAFPRYELTREQAAAR
ncbi:MAG: HAMP domain-containing sensor histidine kinase [Deltaproteobacteria bacterium]|nr:HAMP domain-containing sensor histidine kinase [Deltaproteobacteria bacterium]